MKLHISGKDIRDIFLGKIQGLAKRGTYIFIMNFLFFLFSAKIESVFFFLFFFCFFFFCFFAIVDIIITAMHTIIFMVVNYSLWSSFTKIMDIIGDHVELLILY